MKKRKIGLALSGGGFRASVFHIGVLTFLAEKKQLENISYISTVSGGSLLIGLIYSINNNKWPTSEEFLNDVAPKIKKQLTESSLINDTLLSLICRPFNWRYIFHRVNILAYTLKNVWKVNSIISDIPEYPKLVINATTSETGKSWRFSNEKMGDYLSGYVKAPNIPLSDVMAISAAFPAGFGPYTIATNQFKWFKYKTWSSKDTIEIQPTFKKLHLYDGGVYDNLGVEPMMSNSKSFLRDEIDYLIVSDASKPLGIESIASIFRIVKRTIRLLDITTDQTRSLRARMLFNEFKKNSSGLYIKIGLTVDWIFQDKDINYKKQKFLEIHSPNISNEDKAKSYPTNLSKVKKEDFELISEHGKLVTEALAYAYDFNDSNENFH
jgi:NTE family protein